MVPAGPDTRFRLVPGATLETFDDGTAILFSASLPETLSLNPTAALLCAHADGHHTPAQVVHEVQALFPDASPALADFVACLEDLTARGFLHLDPDA